MCVLTHVNTLHRVCRSPRLRSKAHYTVPDPKPPRLLAETARNFTRSAEPRRSMSREGSHVDVTMSCAIDCAVIVAGNNGPVISWRVPDRRAKRKGVSGSSDDAKPAAPGGSDVAAQLPAATMPVIPRIVKPAPAVRATSNSSRYRGVTRHRRDGCPSLTQRALCRCPGAAASGLACARTMMVACSCFSGLYATP